MNDEFATNKNRSFLHYSSDIKNQFRYIGQKTFGNDSMILLIKLLFIL